jgi:hypothetical protein
MTGLPKRDAAAAPAAVCMDGGCARGQILRTLGQGRKRPSRPQAPYRSSPLGKPMKFRLTALQHQGQARRHKDGFGRERGHRLIEPAGMVAEFAGERIVWHDA